MPGPDSRLNSEARLGAAVQPTLDPTVHPKAHSGVRAGRPSRGSPCGAPAGKVRGRIAHQTRGRVRVQFDVHGKHSELQRLQQQLIQTPGVRGVQVHPKTRSMVVEHHPGEQDFAGKLADLICDTGVFFLEDAENPAAGSERLTAIEHDVHYLVDHSKSGQVIVRYAEHLNRAVKHATNGWVDLRFLLPASVGLCALAFIEVETAPLWVPLALFSFQSFNHLHQPSHPHQPRPMQASDSEEQGSAPDAGSQTLRVSDDEATAPLAVSRNRKSKSRDALEDGEGPSKPRATAQRGLKKAARAEAGSL